VKTDQRVLGHVHPRASVGPYDATGLVRALSIGSSNLMNSGSVRPLSQA
jgi:hypothetical protein